MSSSIRRCLDCPYILKTICVHAYEGGYDPDCRATVAVLNATCRAFHRVASKVLWSRIFSLRPLIQCMPSDVWLEEVVDATDHRSAIVRRSFPSPSMKQPLIPVTSDEHRQSRGRPMLLTGRGFPRTRRS